MPDMGLSSAAVVADVVASSTSSGNTAVWIGLVISIASLGVAAWAFLHTREAKRNELLIELSKQYLDQAVKELMLLRDLCIDFYRAHPDANSKNEAKKRIIESRDRLQAETLRNLVTYWPAMKSVSRRLRTWAKKIDECQFFGGKDLDPIENVIHNMTSSVQEHFTETIRELFTQAKKPERIGKFD